MITRAAVAVSSISSPGNNHWNWSPKLPLYPFTVSSPSILRRSPTTILRSSSTPSQSTYKDRRRRNRNVLEVTDQLDDFIVVNFYRFVYIEDPQAEVARHIHFVKDLDLHGRVYLNEQGINAQYSGPSKDALAYVNWLREDSKFADILVQLSPARNGHAFPKLKLRYKPSLVQLEGGVSHLPLLDSSTRAIPLSPSEWRRKLEAVKERNDKPTNQNFILLDVRNGYEWDIGHFSGAQRPEVDCFRSTSFGISDTKKRQPDPLVAVDIENTEILMYCTGGIRCDVYSTILRQKGFRNLYTLQGGVSHYLEKEGPVEWIGNLFVFDSRLSLPPSSDDPHGSNTGHEQVPNNGTFGRCFICASDVNDLRHRNCANLDCNLLFLCCNTCILTLKGCCCADCTTAPRLRPVLAGQERYKKWHTYRDIQMPDGPDQSVIEVS